MSSPSETPPLDHLGRTPIADGMKRQIEQAFKIVPEGRTGAVIVFHDLETDETTAQLAAKVWDGEKWTWKVAGGGRFRWDGEKPDGWVGVQGSWGGKKD